MSRHMLSEKRGNQNAYKKKYAAFRIIDHIKDVLQLPRKEEIKMHTSKKIHTMVLSALLIAVGIVMIKTSHMACNKPIAKINTKVVFQFLNVRGCCFKYQAPSPAHTTWENARSTTEIGNLYHDFEDFRSKSVYK